MNKYFKLTIFSFISAIIVDIVMTILQIAKIVLPIDLQIILGWFSYMPFAITYFIGPGSNLGDIQTNMFFFILEFIYLLVISLFLFWLYLGIRGIFRMFRKKDHESVSGIS